MATASGDAQRSDALHLKEVARVFAKSIVLWTRKDLVMVITNPYRSGQVTGPFLLYCLAIISRKNWLWRQEGVSVFCLACVLSHLFLTFSFSRPHTTFFLLSAPSPINALSLSVFLSFLFLLPSFLWVHTLPAFPSFPSFLFLPSPVPYWVSN